MLLQPSGATNADGPPQLLVVRYRLQFNCWLCVRASERPSVSGTFPATRSVASFSLYLSSQWWALSSLLPCKTRGSTPTCYYLPPADLPCSVETSIMNPTSIMEINWTQSACPVQKCGATTSWAAERKLTFETDFQEVAIWLEQSASTPRQPPSAAMAVLTFRLLQGSSYLMCALKCTSNPLIEVKCPSSLDGHERGVRLQSQARGLAFEHTGEWNTNLIFALYPAKELSGDWNVTVTLSANVEYMVASGYQLECQQQSVRWFIHSQRVYCM